MIRKGNDKRRIDGNRKLDYKKGRTDGNRNR